MKQSELLKKLKQGGCKFAAHGKRHDLWLAPDGTEIWVPRHAKEIANSILKDAGLK